MFCEAEQNDTRICRHLHVKFIHVPNVLKFRLINMFCSVYKLQTLRFVNVTLKDKICQKKKIGKFLSRYFFFRQKMFPL